MQVVVVETPELGDRSYLVHDGVHGFVVDPQRDLDRMEREIARAGVRVTHVFETHIHNDYVTGGLALAQAVGADYVVAAADEVEFARVPALEGSEFTSGTMTVRALHTPGHTPNHLSYVVIEQGVPRAILSGGSLLYGTVGRTDLISEQLTDQLTRAQFRSARRLMEELPPEVRVLPTHGFGSFCASSGSSTSGAGDIASERDHNLASQVHDEDTFVTTVVSGLGPYPAYYRYMAPLNQRGPHAFAELEPGDEYGSDIIQGRLADGGWVLDTRPRRHFAAAHLKGTVGMELSDHFTTYVGWLMPYDEPVTVLTENAEEAAVARRNLARIGMDHVNASVLGFDTLSRSIPTSAHPVSEFRKVVDSLPEDAVVMDVRQADEWQAGHVAGSVNLPIQELVNRIDTLPRAKFWVHCASGYRASVAASMLDRAGHSVVLIDDDFINAERVGLPIES